MSWKDNVVEKVIETTPERKNEVMKAIVEMALRREEKEKLLKQKKTRKNK